MKKRMKQAVNIILAFILVFVLAGGYASAEGTAQDLSSAVVLLSPARTVYSGAAQPTKVTVMYEGTELAENTDYSVSTGTGEMKDAGSYTVKITGKGGYTGETSATYVIDPVDLSGASITLSRDFSTADVSADGTSINSSIIGSEVTVIQNGCDVTAWCTLTAVVNGSSVTVRAATTSSDGKNVVESSVTKDFVLKTSMEDCEIQTIPNEVYSGEPKKPALKVKNKITGEELVQGTDFTVAYENNVNAGRLAKVTVTGKGRYAGTLSAYFTIEPKNIFLCTAFYTNGRSSSVWTGSAVQPAVTVRDDYYTTLVKNQDYYITYTSEDGKTVQAMQDAGAYHVILNGMGNYGGKLTLDYEILGNDISEYTVTLKVSQVKADGQAKTPTVTSVKYGNIAVLTSSDYDISYLDPSGAEVTELKQPGKYKVVVTGKGSYCGSTSADFEIVGIPQEVLLSKTSYQVYKLSKDFTLKPDATGDGTGFTYVSSDPKVASVSENGVVSIHKLGRAKITVTTTGMTLSAPASKDVYVKVYPYRTVLTQKPFTEGAKKSFRVRWNTQEDVTYYQVRYSTTSSFKAGTYTTKKVMPLSKNYATQSTKITGLKSGKRYYVKVRAVKVAYNDYGNPVYYYGNWSTWKSVVTK